MIFHTREMISIGGSVRYWTGKRRFFGSQELAKASGSLRLPINQLHYKDRSAPSFRSHDFIMLLHEEEPDCLFDFQ